MGSITQAERPVKWEEDGYEVTRTTVWGGPGCHEGCGILLYAKDGKLERVEGDHMHPYNQGRICARCAALPEIVNSEDRLQYPLKRIGQRGEGKWQRISWDEAYGTIEAELKKAISEHGPESVLAFTGTGRMMWEPWRFTFSLGSPNVTNELSGQSCYMPRLVAGIATYGAVYPVVDASQQFEDRYDNPQWRAPEVIIVWGCNMVLSNPDWFFGAWIVECMKLGSRLIVVDPRLTWLSARADVWLDIRPGTDGALALALLNTIIKEGLYDKDFVENWTFGFDELAASASEYTPEHSAEICWTSADKIKKAARLYGNAKPGAIQLGLAIDMQISGLPAAQAIMALQCITGSLDVPGGCIFCPDPFGVNLANVGLAEFVPEETRAKTIGHDKYPILKNGVNFPSSDEVVRQLNDGKPYPLKAGIICGTNFLTCMGQDPLRWKKGALNLDFIMAMDIFMTPTIQELADIVLPVSTFVEKDSFRAQMYNISTMNKALEPLGESKPDIQIVRELGARFNQEAWEFATDKELLDDLMSASGMKFEDVQQNKGWAYPPFEYRKYEKGLLRPDGEPGFHTPTGKVEFFSHFFEHFELEPLPHFFEPVISPVSTPDVYAEYPIVLMTGARSSVFFHSENRQSKTLREISNYPQVEINPENAKELGIKDGDWVWIEGPKDRIRQVAKLTPIIKLNTALSYHAWWYPEIKDPKHTFMMWEMNNNRLLDMGNVGPSGFGSDVKSTLVKIYKSDTSPFEDAGLENY
jgi:anaerobic selenocysteine-containing dehydrogenase